MTAAVPLEAITSSFECEEGIQERSFDPDHRRVNKAIFK